MAKFQSVQTQRRRLADEVYEQILSAVLRKKLGTQDVLVQEKLAEDMEISRTPVREALMRLEQEGVLEVSKRGSFRLRKMGDREIWDLYQTRAAIEGQAARILAERQDPFDIASLREVVASEEAVAGKSARATFEANRNIHRAFVERSGSGFLLEVFDMVWARAVAAQAALAGGSKSGTTLLDGHMLLVDAIASGDAVIAFAAVDAHLHEGLERRIGSSEPMGS